MILFHFDQPRVASSLLLPVFLVVMLVFLLFFSMSCTANTQDRSAPGITTGTYNYIAKDKSGMIIAEGKLKITSLTPNAVGGTWEINTSAPVPQTGPQSGKGKIGGQLSGKNIILDLNPGWRDNNVVLTGTFQEGKLSGTWGWYGIAGLIKKGTFEAIIQKP